VYGECGDVGRSDDAPGRQRGAQLVAALFELVAKEGRRQGYVDEAGGDQVDSNRSDLECEAGREGRQGGGHRRADTYTNARVARRCAAHEQKRASGADLAGGVAGDADHQHRMLSERAARLVEGRPSVVDV
jgi:hypothetical protein